MAIWNKPASSFSRSSEKKGARYIFLVLTAAIMLIGRIYSAPFDHIQAQLLDKTSPIMVAISKPIYITQNIFTKAGEMIALQDEIHQLRKENENLKAWQNKAHELQGQNNALRSLLNFVPEPNLTWVTASVTSSQTNAFTHSVIISAGQNVGVGEGQAVVAGDGLIGRIIESNDNTAIALLLTDIESSIPVMIEHTREKAILKGTNSDHAVLKYLSKQSQVKVGAKVVTSGESANLPAGLPVGWISKIEQGKVYVTPFTDARLLEVLRVITGIQLSSDNDL